MTHKHVHYEAVVEHIIDWKLHKHGASHIYTTDLYCVNQLHLWGALQSCIIILSVSPIMSLNSSGFIFQIQVSIIRALHNCFLSCVAQLHFLCCSATLWRFEVLLNEYMPAKTGSILYVWREHEQVTFSSIFIIVNFYVLCFPVCMALICFIFIYAHPSPGMILQGNLQQTTFFCKIS